MEKRSLGTHDGPFHADEVTACALLLLYDLIDRDKIYRTRDDHLLSSCDFVCDVGGVFDAKIKRFDHHQADYQGRLSSAGMIWGYLLKTGVVDKGEYDFLNNSLIIGVDAVDNGAVTFPIGHASFSTVVSMFVPAAYEVGESVMNQMFEQALDFVLGHIQRLQERYIYIQSCRGAVKRAMQEGKECLFFDAPMPWMDNFFELGGENHPALFVVMPAGKHWKLRGIPPSSKQKMQVRKPLPGNWAGLLEKELKQETRIPGAIFCHKGRFISIWETKEDALKALQYVLEAG